MPKTSHALSVTLVCAVVATTLAGLVACARADLSASQPSGGEPEVLRVVLVKEMGDSSDGSFNALAEEGLRRAAGELDGLDVEVVEADGPEEYADHVSAAADDDADVVLTIGEWMMVPTTDAAANHAETTFVGIDQAYRTLGPNVTGVVFREQEAAYLAGVVAGLATHLTALDQRVNARNVVSFVGGARIPLVERYEAGFIAGVRSVNPTATVLSNYAGSFEDAERGRELGASQIARGADIVFVAAGETGLGVIQAAKDEGALVIGVETDQSVTMPGAADVVLTSAIKRVDVAVAEVVRRFVAGTLEAGRNIEFGLAEDGVGLAPFHRFEDRVPAAVSRAVQAAASDVARGTVVAPQTVSAAGLAGVSR